MATGFLHAARIIIVAIAVYLFFAFRVFSNFTSSAARIDVVSTNEGLNVISSEEDDAQIFDGFRLLKGAENEGKHSKISANAMNLSFSETEASSMSSSWECYRHGSTIFGRDWEQSTCVANSICLVGNSFIHFGNSCAKPAPILHGRVFSPVSCSQGNHTQNSIKDLMTELVDLRVLKMPPSWLKSRQSIHWEKGTTLFTNLDNSATNVYHLVSKTMPWIYFHNLTNVGLPHNLDQVFIRRSKKFLRLTTVIGPLGEHSVIIRSILQRLLQSRFANVTIPPNATISQTSGRLAEGKVLFESNSAIKASNIKNPLCFEKLLFAGCVRGALFEEPRDSSRVFSSAVKSSLANLSQHQSPLHSSKAPKLLYIWRRGSRSRGFSRQSEAAFSKLLKSSPMEVKAVNFGKLSFQRQVEEVNSAAAVIGIHGANFLNPSLFLRPGTAVIELFPFNFLWRGYSNTTTAAGGIYMGYMLDRDKQPLSKLTQSQCFLDKKCLHTFHNPRKLNLTKNDLAMVSKLLGLAFRIATKLNGDEEQKIEEGFFVGLHPAKCHPFDRDRKMAWLSYYDRERDTVHFCVLSSQPIPRVRT